MNAPSTNASPELEGRRLGEFVLGAKIGEGAFGAIYLAEQTGLSRRVVVKILRSRFATDDTMRLRFLREARLASTLDHPYAAHVYAFGVELDGVSWIAMELVRGTSLSDVLAKGAMPLRDFVPFFERLCEVVQTAHEHGIVHRDIKPQNVMVIARAGALLPKLLDLGIAKDAALASQGSAPGVSVVRHSAVHARAEGLAYEAIAGHRPFSGTIKELAEQHLVASVPPLPEGLPGELEAVLDRAMAKEPDDRQASALELARAFRDASRLGEGGLELPRLPRDVAEIALRDFPQPLAEAVAELDGARGAYRALDATSRLTRVSLRFLSVVALAAWWQRRTDQPLAPVANELLSALRKRRLEDAEWLDLLRALVASLASRAAERPVPELVDALANGPASTALAGLIDRQTARATSTLPTEEAAAEELSLVLVVASELLRSLAFLSDYPLAVAGEDDHAEIWMGVRRRHRLTHALPPGTQIELDAPILIARDGRPLLLAPLALATRPSPSAERELFLLEGRGRRGILLVALPAGFEQTSEAMLAWLDRVLAAADDSESRVLTLEAPYRGLAPLTAADADLFFGREREVEMFLNRLRSEPLLAIVGRPAPGRARSSGLASCRPWVTHTRPSSFGRERLRWRRCE